MARAVWPAEALGRSILELSGAAEIIVDKHGKE